MQASLQKILNKYSALSTRERILVVASIWVVMFVAWFNFVSDPFFKKTSQTSSQIANLISDTNALQQQHAKLLQARDRDPHRETRDRIEKLERLITKIDSSLKQKLHGLITPKQMVKVLESVLQKNKNLKLLRVKSIAAVPLLPEEEDGNETPGQAVEIYRHGLQIEFEGNYLATLEYLKALEKLSWEFYWDEVQLEVQEYPTSKVVIRIHTLSLGKGWIGI